MVSINTGRIKCDKCGVDCSDLYGITFAIPEHRMRLNHKVQQASDALDKKYGQHNFCFCVDCSIEGFGIKPLVNKELDKKSDQDINEDLDKDINDDNESK